MSKQLGLLIGLLIWTTGCDKFTRPTLLAIPGVNTPPPYSVSHNQIVLVIGQSNNVRWEEYGEAAFVQGFQKAFPGSTVRFINCAVGGTSISQWQYGGQLMNQCQTGGLIPTVIFFYQGESDAALGSQSWDQQFMSAVAGWRQTFKNRNLPIIYAQLAVEDPTIFCPQSQWDSLKLQQTEVAGSSHLTMIKTDDISQLDADPLIAQGVHLSQQSYVNIASRYVQALVGTILER